jgi:hypothetical protein
MRAYESDGKLRIWFGHPIEGHSVGIEEEISFEQLQRAIEKELDIVRQSAYIKGIEKGKELAIKAIKNI